MKHHQSGFTLIELMLAVLVLAIVLAIALPSYKNFADRAKAAEGYTIAYGLVDDILEYEQFNGALPTALADIGGGLPTDHAGQYVTQALLNADGTITVSYGGANAGQLLGQDLTLVPYVNGAGDYFYVCHPLVPANLTQLVIAPATPTTLPNNLLPQNCRT
jgi:prepilin-type N-terminal cleavage/methylation domain-containing protein